MSSFRLRLHRFGLSLSRGHWLPVSRQIRITVHLLFSNWASRGRSSALCVSWYDARIGSFFFLSWGCLFIVAPNLVIISTRPLCFSSTGSWRNLTWVCYRFERSAAREHKNVSGRCCCCCREGKYSWIGRRVRHTLEKNTLPSPPPQL